MAPEAIKITIHHGEGIVVNLVHAFCDVEAAIDLLDALTGEDEVDVEAIKATVEHVRGLDDQRDAQTTWLAENLKAGESSLDHVARRLEALQVTVESFNGNTYAFYAYCDQFGSRYLDPGHRVRFSEYSAKQLISRELELLDVKTSDLEKIGHLLSSDAILESACRGPGVCEYGGSYYVFEVR